MTTINNASVEPIECQCNEDADDFDLDYVDAVVGGGGDAVIVATGLAVLGLAVSGLHASWSASDLDVLEHVTLGGIVTASVAIGVAFGLISAIILAIRVRRHRREGGDR